MFQILQYLIKNKSRSLGIMMLINYHLCYVNLYIKIKVYQTNLQIIKIMGNSNSVDYATMNKFDINQWTPIETNQIYKIVKDKNGVLAQEYDLITQQKLDQKQQLQIYNFRRIQNEPIIKIYGVNFINTASINNCCGQKHHRIVLTQRIPNRLSTINNLTFNQALYILIQAFKGYSQISKKLIKSSISANMIGITPEGFVKVWINDNWAQNHPPNIISQNKAIEDLQGNYTQQKMIVNLINLVQPHTQGRKFPEQFNDWLNTQNLKNFLSAENTIKSYCLQNNIIISDHITVVKTQIVQSKFQSISPRVNQSNRNISVKFNYLSNNNINTNFQGNNNSIISRNQYKI